MSRKSLLVTSGILLAALVALGTVLGFLVTHEPGFYQEVAVGEGDQRQAQSKDFFREFMAMVNYYVGDYKLWEVDFSENQINSYFAEDFIRSGLIHKTFPENITAPRVKIEADRIRIGFRYGKKPWSTVVSIDLKPWFAAQERDVLALEVQGIHAGLLPIASQSILERFSDLARSQGIEVTWYRNEGKPVALIRFRASRPAPYVQKQWLKLTDGRILLGTGFPKLEQAAGKDGKEKGDQADGTAKAAKPVEPAKPATETSHTTLPSSAE